MWASFKEQFKILIKRKEAHFSFFIIMLLILANFVAKMNQYEGHDVKNMLNPFVLVLFSYINASAYSFYLFQFLPFLIVLPAAFSLIDDLNSGEIVFLRSRLSSAQYVIGKALAVFCVTFIVFEIPFLLEIIMYAVSFPSEAMGFTEGWAIYDDVYIDYVGNILNSRLFIFSPMLFVLVNGIKISLFAAFFAVFSLAFSTLGIKSKIFLFLPVYVVLYFVSYLPYFFALPFSTNYTDYLFAYVDRRSLSIPGSVFFLFFTGLLSVLFMFRYIRKDCP